jgi:hypothetical protein
MVKVHPVSNLRYAAKPARNTGDLMAEIIDLDAFFDVVVLDGRHL